jgi:hypothetical protein
MDTNFKAVGDRIKYWLASEISEFDQKLAELFYDHFRNGLVHEGHIKNGGQ